MAGYIGPAPVPQATQNREAFTATGGQTTFATSGYKPGYLDVYLNGVKLAAADYTATNGSDVVLASGAAASDILEIVAFQEFTVADQAFTGDITFTGASYDAVWDASDNALEFGDNAKATFGASADLQIYHDGSNSYIEDAATGDLILKAGPVLRLRSDSVNIANAANTQDLAQFTSSGAANLYYSGSRKLATTSTGIDVTGDITLGDTNPTITFNDSSITNLSHAVRSASDNLQIAVDVNGVDAGSRVEIFDGATEVARFSTGAVDITGTLTADGLTVDGAAVVNGANMNIDNGYGYTWGTNAVQIYSNGSYLRARTSGTDRLTIDSSGNVMVGGTVAGNAGTISLNVGNVGSTNGGLQLWGTTAGTHYIQFGDDSGTAANHYRGYMAYAHNGDSLRFGTASTERMRIDSSGNLLVGHTAEGTWDANNSAILRASGVATFTSTSTPPLYANRLTSDGDIVQFRKDGSTVGSIGVSASDDFYIGASTANHAGIYFGTDIVYPMRANSLSDGVTSIGHSSNRFNNLYLSGGVYLGGTGAANKLDDYEEGTFTPTSTTNAGTAATFGTASGIYTKIGNVVYFSLAVTNIDTTGTTFSSQFWIDGLPFTVDVDTSRATVLWDNIDFQSTRTSCVGTISLSEYIVLTQMGDNIADTPVDYGDLNSGVTDVFIAGFYFTNQ